MIIERLAHSDAAPFDESFLAQHVRLFNETDLIAEVIRQGFAAAGELENFAQVALLNQEIKVTLEDWPRASRFDLPIIPMLDPLSLTITVDGEAFEEFAVMSGLRPAVRLTGTRPCGLIVVSYEAGFGEAYTDIPADLVHAVMDQAAAYFEMRGTGDGKTNGMSPHAARIAARYRRVSL